MRTQFRTTEEQRDVVKAKWNSRRDAWLEYAERVGHRNEYLFDEAIENIPQDVLLDVFAECVLLDRTAAELGFCEYTAESPPRAAN